MSMIAVALINRALCKVCGEVVKRKGDQFLHFGKSGRIQLNSTHYPRPGFGMVEDITPKPGEKEEDGADGLKKRIDDIVRDQILNIKLDLEKLKNGQMWILNENPYVNFAAPPPAIDYGIDELLPAPEGRIDLGLDDPDLDDLDDDGEDLDDYDDEDDYGDDEDEHGYGVEDDLWDIDHDPQDYH